MGPIRQVLGVLGPTPTTAAFPSMILFMGRFLPSSTTAALLRFEEFLEGAEGSSDECDFSEDVGFEDSEGDDTEEQGNEGSQLQLNEGQDGEELLQLLLLLATAWN